MQVIAIRGQGITQRRLERGRVAPHKEGVERDAKPIASTQDILKQSFS